MQKGTCKHFSGFDLEGECAAGVKYREVVPDPEKPGAFLRCPCVRLHSSKTFSKRQQAELIQKGSCLYYKEPTDQEVATHEQKIQDATERWLKTVPLMAEIKKQNKGKATKGNIECPCCMQKLHFAHAPNGHIWARCETEGCISFIE